MVRPTDPRPTVLNPTLVPPPLSIDDSTGVKHLIMSMGCFGLAAFLLNSFVICRLLYQCMKGKIHRSKLLFFSLAFADMYFGVFCVVYMLKRLKLIKIENTTKHRQIEKVWRDTSIILSLNSSLIHVIMITVDRYLATAFPLFHKVHVTRCKIRITIFVAWSLAFFLALLPLWLKSSVFSEWFYVIVGICGTVLLIVTYTHISIVAVKRRRQLKKQHAHKNKNNIKKSVKSINTTFLSISITMTYVVCMIYALVYHITALKKEKRSIFIKITLFSINAAVNPVLYTIFEYLYSKVSEKRAKRLEPMQTR